ncbi:MAG: hypothetical protein NC453_12870 [Muribaculum sp.]|nr:hypothetical protein [Muribaculum sp.]
MNQQLKEDDIKWKAKKKAKDAKRAANALEESQNNPTTSDTMRNQTILSSWDWIVVVIDLVVSD